MRFVLTYDGPLPSNGSREAKHDIRRQFHPQLKQQWEIEPSLRLWRQNKLSFVDGYTVPSIPTIDCGGFSFVPMVTKEMKLVCSLDITMLRPEAPGGIIQQGGDIDNRIKTLLDSLTVPQANQLPDGRIPSGDEQPFYCLLEDDGLVVGLRVTTERLLRPASGRGDKDVHLDIAVVVRPSEVTNDNLRFLGGWT